jgi:hypothetical protein
MPSPFPGMNPYLEQDDAWHDFHEKFLPAVAERLVPQVRPNYIVKLDEHVYVHEMPHEPRRLLGRADVAVGLSPGHEAGRPAAGVLDAPAQVRLPAQDVERVAFLEVRDRRSRELITVIELLSPSNKRTGSDREQYLAKRAGLLNSRAHLVEIDLLRGGRPMPLDDRPECSYSVLVSRVEERPRAGFWPLSLPDRLPVIPIPLRRPDEDVRLDIQEVLDRVYDASGYEDYLYENSPGPSLTAEEAAWARQFLPRPG